ncbi:type II restriction endonuclease [Roseibium algicola]|uniref:type II restriction endonuclease n=1 Tax=Roseibium algicola TaxID=2857014 RepID=UPI00345B30DE
MSNLDNLLKWTREACARYELEPIAVYRRRGEHDWPITANNETELTEALDQGGHFLPLPKEPAALANIIEVSLVDFLMAEANKNAGISMKKGTERGYPDIDLSGQKFGDKYFAIDIKAARRKASNKTGKVNQRKTQSRITLYTGNTYFKFPQLHWPGTFRPFDDYDAHIDIIAIYTLDESSKSRIKDFELIVQESWRIGSKQRSSTTREYIGAVDDIERLRKGEGEFETKEAFYKFWRKYPFKFGPTAAKQLEKLLAAKDE